MTLSQGPKADGGVVESQKPEKASVVRGSGDRAVVVQGQGRTRDSGTAPIGFAGTPPRGGRTSAWAEETTPTWLEDTDSKRSRDWLWNETSP